jgi:hypothetical protein
MIQGILECLIALFVGSATLSIILVTASATQDSVLISQRVVIASLYVAFIFLFALVRAVGAKKAQLSTTLSSLILTSGVYRLVTSADFGTPLVPEWKNLGSTAVSVLFGGLCTCLCCFAIFPTTAASALRALLCSIIHEISKGITLSRNAFLGEDRTEDDHHKLQNSESGTPLTPASSASSPAAKRDPGIERRPFTVGELPRKNPLTKQDLEARARSIRQPVDRARSLLGQVPDLWRDARRELYGYAARRRKHLQKIMDSTGRMLKHLGSLTSSWLVNDASDPQQSPRPLNLASEHSSSASAGSSLDLGVKPALDPPSGRIPSAMRMIEEPCKRLLAVCQATLNQIEIAVAFSGSGSNTAKHIDLRRSLSGYGVQSIRDSLAEYEEAIRNAIARGAPAMEREAAASFLYVISLHEFAVDLCNLAESFFELVRFTNASNRHYSRINDHASDGEEEDDIEEDQGERPEQSSQRPLSTGKPHGNMEAYVFPPPRPSTRRVIWQKGRWMSILRPSTDQDRSSQNSSRWFSLKCCLPPGRRTSVTSNQYQDVRQRLGSILDLGN